MKKPINAFGARLRALMASLEWNQSELAIHSGVDDTTISMLITGRSSKATVIPASDTLYALSRALGVSMDYLYTGEEYK